MIGQLRSNKATGIILGAVVVVILFVGLASNHLDAWQTPVSNGGKHPVGVVPSPDDLKADALREFYLKQLFNPTVKPDQSAFHAWGAFEHKLPEVEGQGAKPKWTKPLGERLCIIDLDNRPFKEDNQIFGNSIMSWDNPTAVHGLSLGVLNHWLYAKIHGYKYYYIEIDAFEDRRASWKKPPIMAEILKDHDACLYLDSDAIFHHLELPFEWLMNYWEIHPDTNSMALAFDPTSNNNKDKFGKVYLNTGFIIAQNNPKTFEIMKEWEACANDGGKHPECTDFRLARPGKPTDQGGFGTYIRYDYPEDIKELPCTEANGFTESKSGCEGIFIKHLWTGKRTWIKAMIAHQIPGKYLELFHEAYLDDKKNFFFTEKQLMDGMTHPKSSKSKITTDADR